MWKMDLLKSPGASLRNLSKVHLDESKALQATEKRDYSNEDRNSCTRAHVAIVAHVCTIHGC